MVRVFRTMVSAALLSLIAAGAQASSVVTFDSDGFTCSNTISSGGLDFTSTGENTCISTATGSDGSVGNGTPGLDMSSFYGDNTLTITRTGGGTFDLLSFDMAVSWYSLVGVDSILVNGVALDIDNIITTYVVNLMDVTSVTFSAMQNQGSFAYWTADNFTYDVAQVPVPAGGILLLSSLGMALRLRRRRAV